MEILIITILILLNGFFSLSEIALVSSGRSKLEARSSAGMRSARIALKLLEKPENFLSAIQVGITLIGIISGAFGGIRLSGDLADFLRQFEFIALYADNIALVLVVTLITYFSIVAGELVPKTFALNNPERIAEKVAPAIYLLTKITYPIVYLLSISTRLLLKVLFVKERHRSSMTEEELKIMVKTAGKDGVISPRETELYLNLFRFFDRKGTQIMTRKSDIIWLNINDTPDKIERIMKRSTHSKFPVCNNSIDNILGIVTVKDYTDNRDKKHFDIRKILNPVTFIPGHTSSLKILEKFKKKQCHFGVVIDELNTVQGIVTLQDLMENIFGELPDTGVKPDPKITRTNKNTFIVDGETQLDILFDLLGVTDFGNGGGTYSTIAGYILHKAGRIPQQGDSFTAGRFRIEVTDLDGVKIDKVRITKERKRKPV